MAIVSTAPVYPRHDTTPGHIVYIRTQSRATTPCSVVMLPSCVLFLFPRSREKFAKSSLWTTAARTGLARVVPSRSRESGFAVLAFHREYRTVLFSGPVSAWLCPNTSAVRVAHCTARSLSRGVAKPGSRRGGCHGLSLIYHPINSLVCPRNVSRWRDSFRWRRSVVQGCFRLVRDELCKIIWRPMKYGKFCCRLAFAFYANSADESNNLA